jgi:protein SCO1
MMAPRSRLALLAATAAVVVAFTLAVLLDRPAGQRPGVPSSSSGSPSTGLASGSGFDGTALPAHVRAQDFTLSDQSGHPVSVGLYRGQVVVLAFLYSTCGSTCDLIAQQIRGALDELARPVPVLLVSVGSRADTPARVSRFMAQVSLAGRARYLAGSVAQLGPIWRAYGVAPASSRPAVLDSSATILLIDRGGFERVLFPIEQLTPETLAHDIRRLQSQP